MIFRLEILMKLKIQVLAIAIALVVCGNAFAQSSSSSGANFTKAGSDGGLVLKMPIGARATAMGGAFSGLANDLTSVYWNPAGVAALRDQDVDFEYAQSFGGISYDFVAASMPISSQYNLAASAAFLSFGDIPITTILAQDGTGATFTASDMVLGLTFAGNLTDKFSFGISGKYVRTGFYTLAASGLAFDVGTLYKTDFNGMTFGLAISNLGTQEQYSGQALLTPLSQIDPQSGNTLPSTTYPSVNASLPTNEFSLPLLFRAGIAIDVLQAANVKDQKLNLAADFVTFSDNPENVMVGAEYWWQDFVALRAGYTFLNDEYNFSAGVGLKYETGTFEGTINYAFNNTKDLGGLNRIGVSMDFK
ncbi:MAG TPA: PorV/PorQ family protein [Candidatus Kapabacteria bacterium]|nr:PorV/PorQ family protein [Candidatus Kapabacteria bacterium]